MAMFGNGPGLFGWQGSGANPAAHEKGSWQDVLSIIGAGLQDAGAGYMGRPGTAIPRYQEGMKRLADKKQYQDTIGMLFAGPQPTVTNPTISFGPPAASAPPQLGPNREIMPSNIDPGTARIDNPGSLDMTPGGPLSGAQYAAMAPMFQNMDPDKGTAAALDLWQGQQTADRQDARYTQEQAALARRPATPEEKIKYGLDPLTPAEIDGRGNITPISDPRAITPYQERSLANQDDGRKLQWAQFGETKRHNSASEANSGRGSAPAGYRMKADGNLEFIPGGPADPSKGAGKKAPTEDQAKNTQLYTRAAKQLPIALENFDSLGNPANQFGAALSGVPVIGPTKSLVTGPQYQRASGAVNDIAASYLYSVSGATATPSEIAGTVERVTPKPFDSPQTKADKKQRLIEMVESIKARAVPGSQPIPAQTQASGGWSNFRVSQ